MELYLYFQIISTALMVISMAFGVINLKNFQLMSKHEAIVTMLNPFKTTSFVWIQWQVERMVGRETKGSAIPAYIAHKNWNPKTR